MQNKIEPLEPNAYYHIYNRANGNENIFASEENYRLFLKKYHEYILPIADTFCYCLMPNHFHFLIRMKDEAEIELALTGFKTLSGLAAKRFSNLFNAYAQAFNKQEKRKGGLFMRPFKRKRIENTQYLYKLVHYIHFNPVMASLGDVNK
jgi:REP element-mobilizing transposase RayT